MTIRLCIGINGLNWQCWQIDDHRDFYDLKDALLHRQRMSQSGIWSAAKASSSSSNVLDTVSDHLSH